MRRTVNRGHQKKQYEFMEDSTDEILKLVSKGNSSESDFVSTEVNQSTSPRYINSITSRKRKGNPSHDLNAERNASGISAIDKLSQVLGQTNVQGQAWKNIEDKIHHKKRKETIDLSNEPDSADGTSKFTEESSPKKTVTKTFLGFKGETVYFVRKKGDTTEAPCLLCGKKTCLRVGQFTYVCSNCSESKRPKTWRRYTLKSNHP